MSKPNPITPSIGRVVLVRHTRWEGDAPAIVTKVHSDECINVFVMPDNSEGYPLTSVQYDDLSGDTAPSMSFHWMDYQIKVAAERDPATGEPATS